MPERPAAAIRVVTPGFFRTLGIPVLRGREFAEADAANPVQGFIVNDAFVRSFLSGVDPLDESIRIALGEQLARVTRSIVAAGLGPVGAGAAVGVIASLLLLRPLGALLFGVTPNDVATYTMALALLCVIAVVASYVPARRAARVQPLTALRQE